MGTRSTYRTHLAVNIPGIDPKSHASVDTVIPLIVGTLYKGIYPVEKLYHLNVNLYIYIYNGYLKGDTTLIIKNQRHMHLDQYECDNIRCIHGVDLVFLGGPL